MHTQHSLQHTKNMSGPSQNGKNTDLPIRIVHRQMPAEFQIYFECPSRLAQQ
jgi:hypothetical protein